MDTPLLSTFFGEVDRGLSPFAPVLSASKRRPATSPALTALHGRARGASSGGGGRESLVGGFLSNSRGSKPPGFGPGPLTQLQQSGSSSPPSRISLSRFCRVPLQQACAFSALIRAQRALVAAMILLLPASLSLRRLPSTASVWTGTHSFLDSAQRFRCASAILGQRLQHAPGTGSQQIRDQAG